MLRLLADLHRTLKRRDHAAALGLALLLAGALGACGDEGDPRSSRSASSDEAGSATGNSDQGSILTGGHSGEPRATATGSGSATTGDATGSADSDATGSYAPSASETRRSGRLTGLEQWRVLDADEDPWAQWRPEVLECTESQARPLIEEGLIEFDLKRCPWFSVEHPLLQDVREGETLRILASHAVLQALEPSTGHMEIRVDGETIFTYEVPIPHPSAILHELPPAARDYAAGTPVQVHVRNHGPNSWRLHLFEVIP